jgi:hypothetical protein
METYSRIGLLRSYGNLQSYWTTTKLWKLTVVLDYQEAMETYRRIAVLGRKVGNFGHSPATPEQEAPKDQSDYYGETTVSFKILSSKFKF